MLELVTVTTTDISKSPHFYLCPSFKAICEVSYSALHELMSDSDRALSLSPEVTYFAVISCTWRQTLTAQRTCERL